MFGHYDCVCVCMRNRNYLFVLIIRDESIVHTARTEPHIHRERDKYNRGTKESFEKRNETGFL